MSRTSHPKNISMFRRPASPGIGVSHAGYFIHSETIHSTASNLREDSDRLRRTFGGGGVRGGSDGCIQSVRRELFIRTLSGHPGRVRKIRIYVKLRHYFLHSISAPIFFANNRPRMTGHTIFSDQSLQLSVYWPLRRTIRCGGGSGKSPANNPQSLNIESDWFPRRTIRCGGGSGNRHLSSRIATAYSIVRRNYSAGAAGQHPKTLFGRVVGGAHTNPVPVFHPCGSTELPRPTAFVRNSDAGFHDLSFRLINMIQRRGVTSAAAQLRLRNLSSWQKPPQPKPIHWGVVFPSPGGGLTAVRGRFLMKRIDEQRDTDSVLLG